MSRDTEEKQRVFEEVELEILNIISEASDSSGCSISQIEIGGGSMRRHQVRAMMAHAGYPLLGDELYGAVFNLSSERIAALGLEQSKEKALDGFYLLASRLRLRHPISSELLDIVR